MRTQEEIKIAIAKAAITLPVTVVFDVWGQRSQTVFDETSELHPIDWLETCYNLGFLTPVEIRDSDGTVLIREGELKGIVRML